MFPTSVRICVCIRVFCVSDVRPVTWLEREYKAVSIGQFRPEKDHARQIAALRDLLDRATAVAFDRSKVKLVLIGSCRGAEDEGRVEELRRMVSELKLEVRSRFQSMLHEIRSLKRYVCVVCARVCVCVPTETRRLCGQRTVCGTAAAPGLRADWSTHHVE
mgnify:CR=1 FL=1